MIFKNNAPFKSSILKISHTFIEKAEDLDVFMLMYNLLEDSDNYSMTSGSLWKYQRDEVNDDANENNVVNSYGVNYNKKAKSRSFEHKRKKIECKSADNCSLDSRKKLLFH